MRAYNTTLSQYVDWIVNDQPDSTGIYSPYPTNQLTNIVVNKVVGSKVANFLQPDEGFVASDGYFFHLNSFDWLHASVPSATVIPPPTNLVGIAVTRGGTTNASGLLLPGASTNFFATLLWSESQQRWMFVKNTNGDHTTLGAMLPVGMGSTVIDGYLAIGDTPTANTIPTTGSLRLQNSHWITARKSSLAADGYLIELDNLDRTVLGSLVDNPVVYVPGNIRIDGYIRDGSASPSTSGFIRNGNHTSIITFRNQLDNSNVNTLSSANIESFDNNIVIGGTANAAVVFATGTGTGTAPDGRTGVHKFQVGGTTLVEIGTGNPVVNPFIRFTPTAANPSLTQSNTTVGNGQTLNIQAQTTTNLIGPGIGGTLSLSAGDGTSSNGTVDINAGTPSVNNLKIRVFPTTAASVGDNNSILIFENLLRFDALQNNPVFRQDTAASGTGKVLTWQAQNITTGTGGEVRVTSGTGTTTALAGNVNLQTGGVNRLTISPGATNFTGITTHNVNVEQFSLNVPNPSIIQESTPGGSGNDLTIRSQNAQAFGGNLIISSGTGSNDDNAGTVDVQTGTFSRMLIDATGTLTSTATFNVNNFIVTGGTDATNIPNPIWKQADRTATGTGQKDGQSFTIQSQTTTVSNGIGGDLILTAGDGPARDGYVRIQTAGTDRLLVTETQTVVFGDLLVQGTHTNINSTVVDLADRVIHVNSSAASYPSLSPAPTQITGFSVDRGTVGGPAKRDYYGLFWYEPDGYWRFAANTDGYAPGTEQTLSVTLPVIASTFLAQPISATTASAIPTVGGFRALNNTTALASRNFGSTQDLILVGTDTSNHLLWGAGTNNNGTIFNTTTGTSYDFHVNSSTAYKLTLATAGASVLEAATGTTSVTYRQANTSGTGADTTLQSQNSTAGNGGSLYLTSGSGVATANAGPVRIQTGGIDRIITNYLYTEFRDDSAEALRIVPNSSGTTEMLFASTVTAVNIKQTTTGSANGAITTVQSQNAATLGGDLVLTSGTGATRAGYLKLQSGGTSIATVVPSKFEFNGGRRRNVTSVTGNYAVAQDDDYLAVTTLSSSLTITLPASVSTGDTYEVKDTTGNASPTVTVTISGNGKLIDGGASFIFTQAYESATFTYTGSQWSVT